MDFCKYHILNTLPKVKNQPRFLIYIINNSEVILC